MRINQAPFWQRPWLVFFMLITVSLSSAAVALGEASWLIKKHSAAFTLVDAHASPLLVDELDYPIVKTATRHLQTDIEKVTGKRPSVAHAMGKMPFAVIIGTLGKSRLIDALVDNNKINVDAIRGTWDGYAVIVVNNPSNTIKRALVIVGANKRGTTYGIYSLSQQIGVSPWYWWADVPVQTKKHIYLDGKLAVIDIPKVKYRGIFLNDEAPALTSWVKENYGDYNHQFYVNVFELLLRLKANFLWPAMWNNAFADDDPKNMILADEYGIVMSTSHHEPMMRADKEWNRHGKGPWEYSTNPENLYNFWADGAKRNKPYESVYTLGMRGQEDEPMSEGDNIELLENIVRDQRTILEKEFGKDNVSSVPQVWALYKEVQGFYERGMRVPDDVILLWCDDNWGNIRRLPIPDERTRTGGAGIYYHFDYVGGPRSYRWINTVSIAKIWEQMHLAYTFNANQIWIVNVGDLKPMEYPIEFFLNMAWNPEQWPKERIPEFARLWAEREFGPTHAKDIADIMTGYTRHNLRRKPELQEANIYSQLAYGEADRITAEIKSYAENAEKIYARLPQAQRYAFYQLVLFPAKASATVTELYDMQAKNLLYAEQARASTNQYGDRVRALFRQDAALENTYHSINNGKWKNFMNQPHIGYSHWNNPPEDTLPRLAMYEPHSSAEMGIAIEGIASAWPAPGTYALSRFDPFGKAERSVTIFNKGKESFTATAQTNAPWIILSETSIQVDTDVTLRVSIDWKKLPKGEHKSSIHVRGTGWGGATIHVTATNPGMSTNALKGKGFIEADGVISIEAAQFHRQKAGRAYDGTSLTFEEIPEHGRTRSSISVYPLMDQHFEDATKAPYVEYDLYSFAKGDVTLHGYFAPSWPFFPDKGLRYGVSLNDGPIQIVDLTEDMSDATWEETVRRDIRMSQLTLHVERSGEQRLRIYSLDPGVTLQKIVMDFGGLKPSYLGPEQSPRL